MMNPTDQLGGRLSLLSPDSLLAAQKKLYDQLQATAIVWAAKEGFEAETESKEIIGPFNAMLRAPEIATALLGVVSALKEHTVLSQKVQQVIILTVGAIWKADYELYAHKIVARNAGIEEAAIEALAKGQSSDGLSEEENLAHRFTKQLATVHQIDNNLYQQAIETFGQNGVMDMLVLTGQYMIISSMLNTFAVPAPASEVRGYKSNHMASSSLPFWMKFPARTSRRGNFWIPGERIQVKGKTYQQAPMYVAWEAPEKPIYTHPIVLVHGGAMQATEWFDTPDGRPGWAQRLVEEGYVVFAIDRPTQGRSPYHPDIAGEVGPAFSYEEGEEVFFSPAVAGKHTQFPFDPKDEAALDNFIAPFGPLPKDIKTWQEMDADRLAKLLDKIGPAIIMTHSASGSDGWLAADKRPELVAAIVTVEPMGPPFGTTPGIGTLEWGLTAIPVTYDPPVSTAKAVSKTKPASLQIPSLQNKPVAVVSGEVSVQSKYAPQIVAFLKNAGAAVEHLHLPDYGIFGNGHGLIYERNSDAALQPVLQWLASKVPNE